MKRSLGFVLLLLTCGLASAQTNDCAALTRQAIGMSGFNQSIDHLQEMLSSDSFLNQIRGRESADEFIAIFQPIMLKEFNADSIREEIEQRMVAHCDAQQMARTVQRLQEPLVARMLVLEAATNTAEGQKKLKRYITIASTVPPTEDRIDALDAIDASVGISDFSTDTFLAMMRGIMSGAGAPPEILERLQSQRKALKAEMQNNIELSLSVTYHGVTRPELQQYAKELSSQPLHGFYTQLNQSFVELVEERSRAVGLDLKKAMAVRKN